MYVWTCEECLQKLKNPDLDSITGHIQEVMVTDMTTKIRQRLRDLIVKVTEINEMHTYLHDRSAIHKKVKESEHNCDEVKLYYIHSDKYVA